MANLEMLRQKLESAKDLGSVVKTMKAIAAVSIRQYEMAVESLQEYNKTIELGFQVVLKNAPFDLSGVLPELIETQCVIVIGSQQGMCGQFNEDISSEALNWLSENKFNNEEIIALTMGIKINSILENEGYWIENNFDLPGSAKGITESVGDLLLKIDELRRENKNLGIMLFYNKKLSGSSYEPTRVQIYPLSISWLSILQDKDWDSNSLPIFTMEWNNLFASLLRQRLFSVLYDTIAESLASENASRLAAMQAAEKNIGEQIDELSTQYNHVRQESITSELLDIAGGFKAFESAQEKAKG